MWVSDDKVSPILNYTFLANSSHHTCDSWRKKEQQQRNEKKFWAILNIGKKSIRVQKTRNISQYNVVGILFFILSPAMGSTRVYEYRFETTMLYSSALQK